METIYRKVAVSERMPKDDGNYHCIFPEGHIFTIPFLKEYGFHEEFTDCSGITHYLEEIPNPTDQLQKDKEELIEMLEKCKPLISTITRKGKCLPSEIESLIQKHKA